MFSNILKTKKLWKNYIKILKISYTSFLHSTLSIFLIFYLKQILNLGLEKRRRTVSLWKTWEESLWFEGSIVNIEWLFFSSYMTGKIVNDKVLKMHEFS